MIIGKKKRTEKEYRSLDILSASDLRTYAIEDRRTFFTKCILKKREEDENSRFVRIGNAVHCLLLEPQEFDNKFFMSICAEPPTGNMKKFVDNLFKFTMENKDENGEVQIEFKELARLAYEASGIKRDKLETVILNFKGKDPELYYREKRACEGSGKELICTEDRNISDRVVETIRNHDYTRNTFKEHSLKEVQIDDFAVDGLPMKAMIDDIELDGSSIIPTDLKVTWTNENFFREHFIKRRADIQAFIYKRALESKYPGYKIKPFRFVVADSTNFNSPLIYEVGEEWEETTYNGFSYDGRYYKGVKEVIEELKWYRDTNNWSTNKEAYENQGIIKI